ncbi:DsbA family protein [Patescibacteria group bacterium]|nr:DsbA family protein [Patescibacteria group bacterium]
MQWSRRKSLILIVGAALIIFVFLLIGSITPNTVTYTEDSLNQLYAPVILSTDPTRGSTDPTIIVVHFADFACKPCARISQSLSKLLEEFPEELLVVWKDFPNASLHPEAIDAAVAARCAQDQGAFWAYHDALFYAEELNQDQYHAIANTLELKEKKFKKCFEQQQTLDLVLTSYEEGLSLNLIGAPTLYINGERYSGEMSEQELREVIRNIFQP